MTEQEAEAFTERLTQIWEPKSPFTTSLNKVRRYFLAPLGSGIRIEHAIFAEGGRTYWLTEGKEHFEFVFFYIPVDQTLEGGINLDFAWDEDKERVQELQAAFLPARVLALWLRNRS